MSIANDYTKPPRFFLYVLTDQDECKYADLTLLSATFLRTIHPEAFIRILTDPFTLELLTQHKHTLLQVVDEVISESIPYTSPVLRSRYLKTHMRLLITGDFIYLDSDTIIRKPIINIFEYPEPIDLVENHNRPYPANLPEKEAQIFNTNGWNRDGMLHYFNSGVIKWDDSEASMELANMWISNWNKSVENGFLLDQPALNHAISNWNGQTRILDATFNAQIRADPKSCLNAAVWHFYESDSRKVLPDLCSLGTEAVKGGHRPSPQFIDQVLAAKTHFFVKDSLSEAQAVNFAENGMPVRLREWTMLSNKKMPPESYSTLCTIIPSDKLPYALTLLESTRRYDPEIDFHILVTDEYDEGLPVDIKNCHLLKAKDVCSTEIGKNIEIKYKELNEKSFQFSCKPLLINHLIRNKGYERVIYVDPTIHFFSSCKFLFKILEEQTIFLTPEWRSRYPSTESSIDRDLLYHCLYSSGFVGVSSAATDIIDWWTECCIRSFGINDSKFQDFDQPILNLIPIYFNGVHILEDKGCNVAGWNNKECARVRQSDGQILINGKYVITFIQFNESFSQQEDFMLHGHHEEFLRTLKSHSLSAWALESKRTVSIRDKYQAGLPVWYKHIKKKFIKLYAFVRFSNKLNNIFILSHPGTPGHELCLCLRNIPGVMVSDIPAEEWPENQTEQMFQDLNHLEFESEEPGFQKFVEELMSLKKSDLSSMHWKNIRSLLSWKFMLILLPDNSLCWPALAEAIGKKRKTVALFANPFHFALRLHTFENQAWKAKALAEVDDFLNKRPILHKLVHEHESAISRWILKWWIDLKRLKKRADESAHIHIIHEDDLYHAQDETLAGLCEKLGLPYDPAISASQQNSYIYSVEPSQKNKAGQWRRYLSDKEYQTGAELLELLEIT